MNDETRILFLVPSLKRAGAEAQLAALANSMPRDQFAVTVITFLEDQSLAGVLETPPINHIHVQRKRSLDLKLINRIATIIDEQQIDVIHTTMQYCNLLGLLARYRSKLNPRLLGAIHTTKNVDRKNELADKLIYGRVIRKNDWTIFVSERQRRYWLQRFPFIEHRSSVVHNGVDCRFLDPRTVDEAARERFRATVGCTSSDRIISCIAGFRPEKGHRILIDAFASLLEQEPNAVLFLAGDGPGRDSIAEMINSRGLADRVRMPGIVSDIKALLSITELTVLSSTAVETLSMAMLESMSMGVPMVSTRIGGAQEVISEGQNGFLAEVGDSNALSEALQRALEATARDDAVGGAARQTIKDMFSQDRMVAETAELIIKVASDGDSV